METISPTRYSPWPHRLAVALALVTFPLIWVGGLVTTYDAGMAVPDWPGTYGYNLLLYPWQTWIGGPWDLFIEHGHRLLGMVAGTLAIGLVAVVHVVDGRRWLIAMAWGALALVIAQGLLGGARVLLDERLVAMIHACVGPLFFAYLAALVVVTSGWWSKVAQAETSTVELTAGKSLVRMACLTAGMAYGQLVLGAILRHVPLEASPQVFRAALALHLLLAFVLALQIGRVAWISRFVSGARGLGWPASLLLLLVSVQIGLGAGTYVAKYSWPAWLGEFQFAAAYIVREKSLTQSLITTSHVATGSLILFVSAWLATRTARIFFANMNWNELASSLCLAGETPAPLGRVA